MRLHNEWGIWVVGRTGPKHIIHLSFSTSTSFILENLYNTILLAYKGSFEAKEQIPSYIRLLYYIKLITG